MSKDIENTTVEIICYPDGEPDFASNILFGNKEQCLWAIKELEKRKKVNKNKKES